jgi:hypothetical protein
MPRTLLVAYELTSPEATRPLIADTLMSLGEAWARPLDTVWMLRTDLTADVVEARLADILGTDDGLMVQETRGEGAFTNTGLRWFRPRRSSAMAALEAAADAAYAHVRPSAPELVRAA